MQDNRIPLGPHAHLKVGPPVCQSVFISIQFILFRLLDPEGDAIPDIYSILLEKLQYRFIFEILL